MSDLPRHALSVRQPWAWAIIHAGKDIENRDWRKPNSGLGFRGRVCIHASKGMTRAEYEGAKDFINLTTGEDPVCPLPADLRFGGIVGTVDVVDVVKDSISPWFFGRIGLVLANPQPVDFIPAGGQLGFFEWTRANWSDVPEPAKWMRRYGEPAEVAFEERQGDLL